MAANEYAGMGTLSPALERRAQSELAAGERLVWVGRPRPDRYVGQAVFAMIAGAVLAGAGSYMLIAPNPMPAGMGAPAGGWGLNACLPLALLFFGICCVPAAPLWMAKRFRQAAYLLTDRRAIVWEPGWFGDTFVRTYRRGGLSRMYRVDRSGGEGDLVFEEVHTTDTDVDGNTSTRRTQRGFMGIDRVRDVEDLVRLTLMG